MRPQWLLLLVVIALGLAGLAVGCRKPAPAPQAGAPVPPLAPPARVSADGGGATVRVLAEPSLAGALEQLQPVLEQRGALKLQLEYRDSAVLEQELAAGTPGNAAEVYIYPDLGLFAKLAAAKRIDEVSSRTFGGDRLVVACRTGERWTAPKLFDIYRLRFKRLGLAPASTVLGRLGLQALTSDGALQRVQKRLIHIAVGDDLQKALKRDEVQLIVTYSSLVTQSAELGVVVLIDQDLHQDIRYKAAAALGQEAQPGAVTLLRLLSEDAELQIALAGLGFTDRATAMREVQ